MIATVLAITCAVVTVAGILVRPWRTAEWMWALGGAAAVVMLRLVSLPDAVRAVLSGANVYLFLTGILGLAELARRQGIFDWLAARALRAGGGSQHRLFALLFGVGVVVTAILCNDTTAVVLTSAVAAALHRAGLRALPYLYACALVAGAASFVLPMSNPANLVIFGSQLPALWPWLLAFFLPAIAAIAITYLMLMAQFRVHLSAPYDHGPPPARLSRSACVAAWSISIVALGIVAVNAAGGPVGLTAAIGLCLTLALVWPFDRPSPRVVVRSMAWGVLPLVAGLFVIVAALDAAGAVRAVHGGLLAIALLPGWGAHLAIGAAATIAANVFNNLPVALFAGTALAGQSASTTHAALVAIDLGPNLSVTGSLATILWLVVLRREHVRVTPWQFLLVSAIATIPALIAAELLVR